MVPASVTSNPSSIQVTPRAITTNQCHRDHGNRSRREGMSVSTTSPVWELEARADIYEKPRKSTKGKDVSNPARSTERTSHTPGRAEIFALPTNHLSLLISH